MPLRVVDVRLLRVLALRRVEFVSRGPAPPPGLSLRAAVGGSGNAEAGTADSIRNAVQKHTSSRFPSRVRGPTARCGAGGGPGRSLRRLLPSVRGEHANAEKATRRRRERIEDRMRRRSLYRSGMVISFYHDANIITMHTHPRDQGSSGGGPGAVERDRGRQGHCGALTHCAPTPATVATAPVLCGPIRCAIAVVFAAQRHEVALHAGCAGRSSTRPDGERPPIMHTAARCDALVYKSIEATSAAVCRALKSRAN